MKKEPGTRAGMQTVATVAVDVAVFTIDGDRLKALLVQIKQGPFAGRWAFPGGLVPRGESLDAAAQAVFSATTGVRPGYLEQLYTFGDPLRDPSGHVVSVTYLGLAPRAVRAPGCDPKYARVEWHPLQRLSRLAYGHKAVAAAARKRLRGKLAYSNIAYGLLPAEFTLGELQRVYEVILGRRLDRRNFRKKILLLGLLRPANKVRRGRHRPAALYAFTRRTPTFVDVL